MVRNIAAMFPFNGSHRSFAVLCDKPITATFAQATELSKLAKSKNLVLYPYQNRRWDSDFLALRELLSLPASDPNSIGTVFELESRYAEVISTISLSSDVCINTLASTVSAQP